MSPAHLPDAAASTAIDTPDQALPPATEIAAAYAHAMGRQPAEVQVSLQKRQRRFRKELVEIRVSTSPSSGAAETVLVGKRYTTTERGANAFRLLRYLAEQGMSNSSLDVVRPVAYLDRWQFLMMAKAAGRTVTDALLRAPNDEWPVRLAARWLRRLHGIAPAPWMTPQVASRAERDLPRIVRDLTAALPHEGDRIRALGRHLRAAEAPVSSPCTLHGDFHPENVLVDGDHVTVIDFDHGAVGDVMWDVGYFVGQLEVIALERLGGAERLRAAARAFVDEYFSGTLDASERTFRGRLEHSRVLTLLESLHYRCCILHVPGAGLAEQLLAECERALARRREHMDRS